MEIKNENKTIIAMEKEEFEGLKKLIGDNCVITSTIESELRNAFPAQRICNELFSIANKIFIEDYDWVDIAFNKNYIHRTHNCFGYPSQPLFNKIKNLYHLSIKLPELFTDQQLDEIKFQYGILLKFEYAMYHLANAGIALSDIAEAVDNPCEDYEWVFELVDKVEEDLREKGVK